jgi:hypothetical protein
VQNVSDVTMLAILHDHSHMSEKFLVLSQVELYNIYFSLSTVNLKKTCQAIFKAKLAGPLL